MSKFIKFFSKFTSMEIFIFLILVLDIVLAIAGSNWVAAFAWFFGLLMLGGQYLARKVIEIQGDIIKTQEEMIAKLRGRVWP